MLINDDLPTFDFPTKTICGKLSVGYCAGFTADIVNSEFLIIIVAPIFYNK